jgi:tetratricopeptide (TPR) repeat protein
VLLLTLYAPLTRADWYCTDEARATQNGNISLHDVLSDNREEKLANQKARFFRNKLAELEALKSTKQDDITWQNDYAVTLYQMGRRDEAKAIWQKQLTVNASQIEALGNLATAAETEGKYPIAKIFVEQLVTANPNVRCGAEILRLKRLTYMIDSTAPPQTNAQSTPKSKPSFWFPEMLEAWENRPKEIGQWEKDARPFPSVTEEGLVEMLAYNMRFGDGWHVLGMLLEKKGNLRQASVAYAKALKNHPSQRATLEPHDTMLRKFIAESMGSRKILSNALWLGLTLVFIAIAKWGYGLWRNAKNNLDIYKNIKR